MATDRGDLKLEWSRGATGHPDLRRRIPFLPVTLAGDFKRVLLPRDKRFRCISLCRCLLSERYTSRHAVRRNSRTECVKREGHRAALAFVTLSPSLDTIPINRSLPLRKVNPAEAISSQLTVHTVYPFALALEMFPGFKGSNCYGRGIFGEGVR